MLEANVLSEDPSDIARRRHADVTALVDKLPIDLYDWRLMGRDHPFARALEEFAIRGRDPKAWATNAICARLAYTAGDLVHVWNLLARLHGNEAQLVNKLLREDAVGGILGEAFIASQLANTGLELEAVPTGKSPTPEFIARQEDVSAEVEVKVRQYSQRDREAQDFWKRLYDAINSSLSHSGWFVQVESHSASLGSANGDQLAAAILAAMGENEAAFSLDVQPDFRITGRRILGLRTNPNDLLLRVGQLDEFAIFEARAQLHPSFSGELDHAIACWRSRRGGHLPGLQRAMMRAGQKFSGSFHSLVTLLLSDSVYGSLAVAARRDPEAVFRLANDFAGYLKRSYFPSHPGVSEVRLYMQATPVIDGVARRQVACYGVPNSSAPGKLPTSFGLRSDPDWSWVNPKKEITNA